MSDLSKNLQVSAHSRDVPRAAVIERLEFLACRTERFSAIERETFANAAMLLALSMPELRAIPVEEQNALDQLLEDLREAHFAESAEHKKSLLLRVLCWLGAGPTAEQLNEEGEVPGGWVTTEIRRLGK